MFNPVVSVFVCNGNMIKVAFYYCLNQTFFTHSWTLTEAFLCCYFRKLYLPCLLSPIPFETTGWSAQCGWNLTTHTLSSLRKTDFNYRRSFQCYITSSQTKMIMHIDEVWTQTSFLTRRFKWEAQKYELLFTIIKSSNVPETEKQCPKVDIERFGHDMDHNFMLMHQCKD